MALYHYHNWETLRKKELCKEKKKVFFLPATTRICGKKGFRVQRKIAALNKHIDWRELVDGGGSGWAQLHSQ